MPGHSAILQGCRNPGANRPLPPDFGRSLNPISIKGQITPTILLLSLLSPNFQTFLRPWTCAVHSRTLSFWSCNVLEWIKPRYLYLYDVCFELIGRFWSILLTLITCPDHTNIWHALRKFKPETLFFRESQWRGAERAIAPRNFGRIWLCLPLNKYYLPIQLYEAIDTSDKWIIQGRPKKTEFPYNQAKHMLAFFLSLQCAYGTKWSFPEQMQGERRKSRRRKTPSFDDVHTKSHYNFSVSRFQVKQMYHTRGIITCGLHIYYTIFEVHFLDF